MRRYDIASGILLILSIIDFSLAAPVFKLAQEKRHENADVVHMPKDVISVLGKRLDGDLEKLGEEFLKTGGKPVESSSSAPSGLDNHGSTNVAQPPAPNSAASSTANPDPPMDPSSCSPSALSKRGPWARGACLTLSEAKAWRPGLANEDGSKHNHPPLFNLNPPGVSPGGLASGLDHGLTAPPPQRIPRPKLPNPRPPGPIADPPADPEFDWNYRTNAEDPPKEPPRKFGEAYWRKVDPAHPPSTSGHGSGPSPDLEPQKEPEDDVVPGPGSPTSPDNQPVDLQAAMYAAKGKAKVPGTTRDHVGNAAQRDLQPAERSLDSGE
jgi:hypothetical protein